MEIKDSLKIWAHLRTHHCNFAEVTAVTVGWTRPQIKELNNDFNSVISIDRDHSFFIIATVSGVIILYFLKVYSLLIFYSSTID